MSGRSCKGRRCVFRGDKLTLFSLTRGAPVSGFLPTASGLARLQAAAIVDIWTESHSSAQVSPDDRGC